jgi:hypothetical protein
MLDFSRMWVMSQSGGIFGVREGMGNLIFCKKALVYSTKG